MKNIRNDQKLAGKSELRMGLDVDGVLADFLHPFLACVAKRLNIPRIPCGTVRNFGFKNHSVITEEVAEECLQTVARDPGFWRDLPSLVSKKEWSFLDLLNKEERLWFITNRLPNDSIDIEEITARWLERHGISKPVVHIVSDEKGSLAWALKITHFVDDRHENCLDVLMKSHASVYMPSTPYNQSFHHPRIQRIQNLSDLISELDSGASKPDGFQLPPEIE